MFGEPQMKPTIRWTLLVAAFLLIGLNGCDKKEKNETPAEETEQGASAEATDDAAAAPEAEAPGTEENAAPVDGAEESASPFGEAAKVELLDAGSEPRRAIRYDLAKFEPVIVRFTVQTSSKVTAGDQPAREISLPEMTLDIAMKQPTIQADGNARVEFELIQIQYQADEEDPQSQMMAQMMSQQLGSFEYSGHYIINPRGQVVDGAIKMDESNPQIAQMSENIEQSLQQITNAFPEEPVGKGARWSVDQAFGDSIPFELEQSTIYEITAIDGDRITLKTTVAQEAEAQVFEDDSMPEGSRVELEEFKTDGSGETVLTLSSLAPKGELTIHMLMAMKGMLQGEEEQSMRTEMTMKMSMDKAPDDVKLPEDDAPAGE